MQQFSILLIAFVTIIGFQNCSGGGDLSAYTNGSSTSEASGGGEENQQQQASLSIDDQSANITRFIGDNVTFSVTVSGSDNIDYQWYKDGAVINGAINSTYTLQSLTANDAGTYYAIISDGNGEADTVQSNNMLLTVSGDPKVTIYANPSIAQGGKNYRIYTVATQPNDIKAMWLNGFCIRATNNANATAEAFTEGTAGMAGALDVAYINSTGVCPTVAPFVTLGGGWCGYTFSAVSTVVIPYTEIRCRVP